MEDTAPFGIDSNPYEIRNAVDKGMLKIAVFQSPVW